MIRLATFIAFALVSVPVMAQQTTPAPAIKIPPPMGTGGGSPDGKPKDDGWSRVVWGRPGVAVAFPSPPSFLRGLTPTNGEISTALASHGRILFIAFWVDAPKSAPHSPTPREVTEMGLERFSEVLASLSGVSISGRYDRDVLIDGLSGGQAVGASKDGSTQLLLRGAQVGTHFLWYGCAWSPYNADPMIAKFIESVDVRE